MSYTGNKAFNICINSGNRSSTDNAYDFTKSFYNDEIRFNSNEGVNINVVWFIMLNSMYNVIEFTENNRFKMSEHVSQQHYHYTALSIPYGNNSVYSFIDKLKD